LGGRHIPAKAFAEALDIEPKREENKKPPP